MAGPYEPERWAARRADLESRIVPRDQVDLDIGAALHRLSRVVVDDMGFDGAVVTLMTPSAARLGQAVAGASDPTSHAWEEMQMTLGEGPGAEAFDSGRPVLAADLDDYLERWPGFAPEAQRAGIEAVHTFPVQLGWTRFGVLTCYSTRPRSLTPEEEGCLLDLADIATGVLISSVDTDDGETVAPGLLDAMDVHTEVYQAQGMVMAQLGVSLGEALVRMRGHAFATDTSLTDLSRAILAGTIRLTDGEQP